MNKPIVIESNVVPNLLQFVLVGLEAGDFHKMAHPPYRDEYSAWISQKTREYFSGVFRELTGVSSSTWFALLYQIPGYLADDSIDSLIEILHHLSSRDTISVVTEQPEKAEMIERYIPKGDFSRYTGFEGMPPEPYPSLLKSYSDIINDVYRHLYQGRWSDIRPELEKTRLQLEREYFRDFDWIHWWEKRTGIEFVYPHFQVELIDAMTTMGTSLLAERDGFYAHANPLRIATMVSHEICTHMLFSIDAWTNEVVGPLMREDLERYLRVVEVVSWATNKEIITELGFDWTMTKSFDWVGPQRDDIVSLVLQNNFDDYWYLMERGYSLMRG